MEIKRDRYLARLVSRMWNGQVKVVTGIRRCGKSYLLKRLFKRHLVENEGVQERSILTLDLDDDSNIRLRNPLELSAFVRKWMKGRSGKSYLFIDEIQMCEEVPNPYTPGGKPVTFCDSLNGFLHIDNLDIYVTGSNSKMLSSDVLTEFRGRGDEVRLHPLSFGEYFAAVGGDRADAFRRYMRFGGMPFALSSPDDAARESYLKSLFAEVYFKDIVERKKVERMDVLGFVMDFLCSSVGSLTNPSNIANSLKTNYDCAVSKNTVCAYLDHLMDAFLFSEAKRYDIKGRTYFDYPSKYYCEDVGLRNARTDFRQMELAAHA